MQVATGRTIGGSELGDFSDSHVIRRSSGLAADDDCVVVRKGSRKTTDLKKRNTTQTPDIKAKKKSHTEYRPLAIDTRVIYVVILDEGAIIVGVEMIKALQKR